MSEFDEYKNLIDYYKKAIDIIDEVCNGDGNLAVEIVRSLAKNNPDILFSGYMDAKNVIRLYEN